MLIFIMRNRVFILVIFVIALTLNATDIESKENYDNVQRVKVEPDTVSILKNPLSGWVMYARRNWDENFWETQGYDSVRVKGIDEPVRVSDYTNTCYIRTSWAAFEPQDGVYIWNDKSSKLMGLINSVIKRGMKLAFRIVVDGRDQGQNTPMYVFDAGAKGFTAPNMPNVLSPYPDDPLFQEKYSRFIEAFAKKFDDPDIVEFIDGFGLGKWGEAHAVKYKKYQNKKKVFDWITDLYANNFKKVPLLINYHREVGDTISWGDINADSKGLLELAIKKGYSVRHDDFGMNGYYKKWEKQFDIDWFGKRPIIMEGGWITGAHHRYWIDPCGCYREGHAEDVRKGEYKASSEARVNMMDFRTGDEIRSWFAEAFDLVKLFSKEGGYRLFPDMITAPKTTKKNGTITITHKWNNIGWGYCPTNIPQWNQKYKVAIALYDKNGRLAKIFVENKSDLSKWMKGSPTTYTSSISLKEMGKGIYTLAVGLVDITKNNAIGINMAISPTRLISGWLKVCNLTVK